MSNEEKDGKTENKEEEVDNGKILMIGLDAGGKTTLLYKLKLGEVVTSIPTVGFNVETITHKQKSFTIHDVGGQEKVRKLWKHYTQDVVAVIFVVDANDRDRLSLAGDVLHQFIANDDLKDAKLLVYVNKLDLPNACTVSKATDELRMHKMREREWYVQGTCAVSGEGCWEGIDWLISKGVGNEVKEGEEEKKEESSSSSGEESDDDDDDDESDDEFIEEEVKCIMIGLDAGGKTSMFYKIKTGESVTTIPTMGFNCDTVEYKKKSFLIYDMGGQEIVREKWSAEYKDTKVVIFVVDSNDLDRFDEARKVMEKVLEHEALKDAILLVYANKDLPNAANVPTITDKLKLHLMRKRDWYIQACCAITGDGLFEGLEYIAKKNYSK